MFLFTLNKIQILLQLLKTPYVILFHYPSTLIASNFQHVASSLAKLASLLLLKLQARRHLYTGTSHYLERWTPKYSQDKHSVFIQMSPFQ